MKRSLLIVLALVLSLGLALGGTMAYLQDTDSDVNVMTLGNVYIDQLENGASENGFENGQPLYPAYYEDEIDWENNESVVDKEVTVENTGKSDAYVRTWFAFEAGEMTFDEFQQYILLNLNDSEEWTWEWDETTSYAIANENGVVSNYFVAVATRNEPLPAGETTEPSLIDLAMSKEGTNEIVEAMGDYYTVLVTTQAMQTLGFEDVGPAAALAEGFADEAITDGAIGVNHPWEEGFEQNYPVPPTKVHNLEELNAVVDIGEPSDAIFANDIDTGTLNGLVGVQMKEGTIDGDGYSLYSSSISRGGTMINPTGGTIKNVKIDGNDGTSSFGIGSVQFANTTLVEDLIIENVEITDLAMAISIDANGHNVYIKNSTIANNVQIANAESIVFENCHFTQDMNPIFQKESLIMLLDSMTFINCHFEESVNFYLDNTNYGGTLTFDSCTYGNNGVEDRPFEPTVGFFTWWMQPQNVVGHKGTFGEGKPAHISFTCIVDGTTVWEAQQ